MTTFPYRIGALDLSLTGTALADYDAWSGVTVSTVDTTKLDGHRRLHEILVAVAALRTCHLVVIEDVFRGLKGDASIKLAGLHYLVRHWLWLQGIPYVLVTNAQLKLFAVGKGSGPGTDKDAVLLAVERRFGDQVKVANNNEADAFVLLAMALEYYGRPLADVPVTHRAALRKVEGWPVLNAEPGAATTLTPTPDPAGK